MNTTLGDRAWSVPQDQFVAAWNAAKTLDEAASAIRKLAGGTVPRWAVLARASALRKDGIVLKVLRPG